MFFVFTYTQTQTKRKRKRVYSAHKTCHGPCTRISHTHTHTRDRGRKTTRTEVTNRDDNTTTRGRRGALRCGRFRGHDWSDGFRWCRPTMRWLCAALGGAFVTPGDRGPNTEGDAQWRPTQAAPAGTSAPTPSVTIILLNCARARITRDRRSTSFSDNYHFVDISAFQNGKYFNANYYAPADCNYN